MPSRSLLSAGLVLLLVAASLVAVTPSGEAAQDGTLTIGLHVTLVNKWLDPAETEGLITPFMVLYGLHDALVKPMPGNPYTPCLAESFTQSKDGLAYEFVLRKGTKFHNGEPITADDVKFSFDRFKGSGAKLLKEKVKDVQVVSPSRVRIVLKEPWPDFMAFYGTSATGAGWIVPKKYVEKVGDEGFKKAPVGAGPFKLVSFTPGIEIVLEAFPEYWRKAPQVKRIVMKSIPDESTRAAAVKTGEADIAYLFSGAIAEELRRTPGLRIVAPLVYGMYWLDFVDQWDAQGKSPWRDRRVRLAANLAIDRNAINQAEMLGFGKPASTYIPASFEFALQAAPHPFDLKQARQLMTEAGYPNGFDAGDLTPLPPYNTLAESAGDMLRAINIRTRVRSMERASFLAAWREKKLHGIVLGSVGAAGNAATRLEMFVTKNGVYSYGTLPELEDLFARQAKETDKKQREALLHQIQKVVIDQAFVAPLFQQALIWGVGPRVQDPAAGLIQGYAYAGPMEDIKLK
jgi:peptide/nickel transport system substrate-binding protein